MKRIEKVVFDQMAALMESIFVVVYFFLIKKFMMSSGFKHSAANTLPGWAIVDQDANNAAPLPCSWTWLVRKLYHGGDLSRGGDLDGSWLRSPGFNDLLFFLL